MRTPPAVRFHQMLTGIPAHPVKALALSSTMPLGRTEGPNVAVDLVAPTAYWAVPQRGLQPLAGAPPTRGSAAVLAVPEQVDTGHLTVALEAMVRRKRLLPHAASGLWFPRPTPNAGLLLALADADFVVEGPVWQPAVARSQAVALTAVDDLARKIGEISGTPLEVSQLAAKVLSQPHGSNVADCSRELHLHRSSLFRRLRSAGLPPPARLIVAGACLRVLSELQVDPNRSIESAALAEGFYSRTSFSRAFRRLVHAPAGHARYWFGPGWFLQALLLDKS